jgi:hypothetical protein
VLKAGLKARQFENFVFQVWRDQNIDGVVARIRQEWLALGTYLSIGDIAWFWLPR